MMLKLRLGRVNLRMRMQKLRWRRERDIKRIMRVANMVSWYMSWNVFLGYS